MWDVFEHEFLQIRYILFSPLKSAKNSWSTMSWPVSFVGLSVFRRVQLFAPMDVARQAPLSVGFSRQEYWKGLPLPSSGELPNPGIKPVSPASPALQIDSLPLSHWVSPLMQMFFIVKIIYLPNKSQGYKRRQENYISIYNILFSIKLNVVAMKWNKMKILLLKIHTSKFSKLYVLNMCIFIYVNYTSI